MKPVILRREIMIKILIKAIVMAAGLLFILLVAAGVALEKAKKAMGGWGND